MTLRELVDVAGRHPWVLVAVFVVPPLAAWLAGLLHGRGNGARSPWRYGYSVLVYWVSVPGLFAAVLTAYAVFFTRDNLLDVNLLVYLLPVLSMAVTLLLIRSNVDFDQVPGFDRLWGLMVTIGASFGVALAIQRTRIWLVFGASIWMLFVLAGAVFLVLRWGGRLALGSREDR